MNFKPALFPFLVFIASFCCAQDTIQEKQIFKKNVDIDGNINFTSEEKDSVDVKALKDNDFASALDQEWLEELYGNSLFDTIYKSIGELKYEEVYYPELPTDTLKKRLAILNAKTPFNVEYNPALESVIKTFLKNRRISFERLMGLSHFYFPMFEYEFDKYNIPLELKYLAIVESALKPRARSRVGATGLWHFMFSTGKMY